MSSVLIDCIATLKSYFVHLQIFFKEKNSVSKTEKHCEETVTEIKFSLKKWKQKNVFTKLSFKESGAGKITLHIFRGLKFS